jgi:hypothetical protein
VKGVTTDVRNIIKELGMVGQNNKKNANLARERRKIW